MEERQTEYREDEIDLGIYFAILRKVWWKVALLSLAVGVVTLIVMFQMPNIYQATAVITPEKDERRQNPSLGALASMGIDVGGPSKVEDLETLFKSNDLTVRVFKKYNLWVILLGDKYDPVTGGIKVSGKGSFWGGGGETEAPRRLGRDTRSERPPAGFRCKEGEHYFRIL